MSSERLDHDWFPRPLPSNIRLGKRSWLYSAYAFAHYRSQAAIGLDVGNDTGVYNGTFFDLGPEGQVEIGDYCSLVGVIFSTNGRVAIGDYSFIAHEVVIADNHWAIPMDTSVQPSTNLLEKACVDIGRNVWVGAQAVFVGSVQIGEGAVIGAGTLVTANVPPYTLCAGNPMKLLRTLARPQSPPDR